MIPALAKHAHNLKFLVNENSTSILTGVGVAGTVATAYLTGRGTFKAAEVLEQENAKNKLAQKFIDGFDGQKLTVKQKEMVEFLFDGEIPEVKELTDKEKALLVWKHYLPAAGVGLITIAAIILAHRISSKRIAALVVASSVSERAFQEYKDKVLEKFGENKEMAVRDEVAQDRVNDNHPDLREVIITDKGDVLCYESLTGRYFMSTVEQIRHAQNIVNQDISQQLGVSFSRFCEELGLPPTNYTDHVGWHMNNLMEVRLTTAVISPDGRPCISVDYSRHPVPEYDQAWT